MDADKKIKKIKNKYADIENIWQAHRLAEMDADEYQRGVRLQERKVVGSGGDVGGVRHWERPRVGAHGQQA
jgi:hypothetical protein